MELAIYYSDEVSDSGLRAIGMGVLRIREFARDMAISEWDLPEPADGSYVHPDYDVHLLVKSFGDSAISENDRRIGGRAVIGTGIAAVNVDLPPGPLQVSTTHELSHALGFVLPGAEHADPESPEHCGDNNCVMTSVVTESDPILYGLANLQKAKGTWRMNDVIDHAKEVSNIDFCSDCSTDMGNNMDTALDAVKTYRSQIPSQLAL